MVVGGLHYADPNSTTIPKLGDDTGTLPGQKKAYSTFNLEIGLRWEIYFPASYGVFFEMDQERPVRSLGGGLNSWQHFTGGLLWAIGAK